MLFWRCESMCGIAIKFRVFVFKKKPELRQKSHLDSYFLLGGYLISFVFFNRYIMVNLAKNEKKVKRLIGLRLRYAYLQNTDFAGRFISI